MNFENTMMCRVGSRKWDGLSEAWWAAEKSHVTLRGKEIDGDDIDFDALPRADHSLCAASAAVVGYVDGDPAVSRDKNRMYLALMSASAFYGDSWLEKIATAIAISTGEPPYGWKLSGDSEFNFPVDAVWAPAIQYWDCFKTGAQAWESANAVVEGLPATSGELADKLKAIAFYGALVPLSRMATFEPGDHPELGIATEFANRILGASKDQCLAAFNNDRTFEQNMEEWMASGDILNVMTPTRCCLLGLGTAPREWRAAVRRDQERLWDDIFGYGTN